MPANDRPQFTLNPLLWLSISFAVGIVIAVVWKLPVELLIGTAAAFVLATAFLRETSISSFFVLAAFCSLGVICYNVERSSVSYTRLSRMYDEGRLVSGDPVEVEGTVIGAPEPASDGYFVTLNVARLFVQDGLPASGKLRLFLLVQTTEAKTDFEIL